jgi:hypothetical protein
MATTYLSYTQATPTNNKKWTWSAWCKLAPGSEQYVMSAYTDANNNTSIRFLGTDGRLDFQNYVSSSDAGRLKTTRHLRDPGAWYHIVCIFDSDNVTSGDRQQIWINGVRETDFDTETYPGSGAASILNASGIVAELGRRSDSSDMFAGMMAHVHFCDGQAYAASEFGETDSTSGIWIAKTSPSVTYGDNGYFMKFASGASGTDSSGESNNMTVSGTMTNLKDNPDNNFCTMNPLDNYFAQYTYSNANQTITNGGSKGFATGTFALRTGKWYWEMKPTAEPGGAYSLIGIADYPTQGTGASNYLGYTTLEWGYSGIDGSVRNNQLSPAYGNTWASGDILGVYLDLDNNKLYFAIDGVIQNSGTGVSITAAASTTNGYYFPATGYNDTSASVYNHNFGQGYFGTTAVTSGVADAGGEGTFEYNPSTGTFDGSSKDFRAICTNNIATYG